MFFTNKFSIIMKSIIKHSIIRVECDISAEISASMNLVWNLFIFKVFPHTLFIDIVAVFIFDRPIFDWSRFVLWCWESMGPQGSRINFHPATSTFDHLASLPPLLSSHYGNLFPFITACCLRVFVWVCYSFSKSNVHRSFIFCFSLFP